MGPIPPIMNPDRYSPNVESRYQAALAENGTLLPYRWPSACFGSGNAFLALIGPSKGQASEGKTSQPGGPDRPDGDQMAIGYFQHFNWHGSRTDRWRRLSHALLGGAQYVDYLTAVLNLDWSHNPNEKTVPDTNLHAGFAQHVWPTIIRVKPRLLCALTNRVWEIVGPTVQRLAVQFPACPVLLPREPIFFRLPNSDFVSMLIKSHNHPSRHFLTDTDIQQLGMACAWFLQQPA